MGICTYLYLDPPSVWGVNFFSGLGNLVGCRPDWRIQVCRFLPGRFCAFSQFLKNPDHGVSTWVCSRGLGGNVLRIMVETISIHFLNLKLIHPKNDEISKLVGTEDPRTLRHTGSDTSSGEGFLGLYIST